ncbi:hypothetical protein [Magnetospira sp. QH-2]|uniref:hypothetical protein n=1 Tax=Magnetospira sp. (strain QH-2) TaxID=1288970 RepID=UPI00208F167C|nr:hypothetical protein [Magnetospira sp. QH-2]
MLLVPACSFTEEALWPSLTGEDPAGEDQAATQTAEGQDAVPAGLQTTPVEPAAPVAPMPQLGTGDFQPQSVSPGVPTGTYVGKKVIEMRDELSRLHGSITQHNEQLQQVRAGTVQHAQRFHGTLAAIYARLQVGTTPGNPILVQQYNSALEDLDRMGANIAEMNKVSQSVTADATMAGYLTEAVTSSFRLSGAVDEDHEQLAVLEDETKRTAVLIERLLGELSDDMRRSTDYVRGARADLNTLGVGVKTGEMFGQSLTHQVGGPGLQVGSSPMDTTGRRPVVLIRFDRENVPYQQALYNAVSQVLKARPDATFDLVAVAPAAGGNARVALNTSRAKRSAEGVLRELVDMGLPPNRIIVSARTSVTAISNEVHLYLR